ncbi:DUF4349 domain-containing protein [Nocardia caishijiensis]|uniref:Uncharacterized protein DUF4349 n=1 Tax=Nocardia caishijiensis TaxID=184756 RepID=A0ABQ6YRK5_9NOCA|nr:DUF4349 domain-containing protein [Nocardia caishijiensis]KAF0848395.1 uncharacterized protein DUF4349 [Nocardia caishijiensis]
MRKLVVVMIALLGLVFPVGCGGAEESASDQADAPSVSGPAAAVAPGFREGAPAKDSPPPSDSSTRKEVITGSVAITADDPIAAAGTVVDRVRALNGRVDSRTEQPGTDKRVARAVLSVRVPADKTDTFITDLGDAGTVTEISTNRDDVTMQWQDLDARINALRASVDRLKALIAGATNTADLIAAEEALSSRQGELDSLTAQKRSLDDQVALSTLTITLTAEKKQAPGEPDSFWDGLVSGWNSLVDWLGDAVVFAGKAVPWLGLFALLGGVLYAILRVVRRSAPITRTAATPGAPPTVGKTEPTPPTAEAQTNASASDTATSSETAKENPGAHRAGDDQTEQP